MEILQLRILSYEEVKKDVTSVSTKVNELWTTLEERGFMNPRRTFYFQKMLEELEKIMKDVELEKEQSR
ncbi:hypothetical protein [[Ruminococcus] torques]|uniref:hypothetical protein n=1 Tax=[Ruminococcus] torques TaxID=33039 RepID=UPI0039F51B71